MVAQTKTEGSERGSALAHTFIIYDFCLMVVGIVVGVVDVLGYRRHIPYVGIVDVLCFADGTDSLQVEEGSELQLQTQFYTIVFFLDAGHGDISEGVDVVKIEVLPLGDIFHATVVTAQTGREHSSHVAIGYFRTEYFFILQVTYKVIVDFGRYEDRGSLRSPPFVAGTQQEGVSASGRIG